MTEFARDLAKDRQGEGPTEADIIEDQVRGREAAEHQLGIKPRFPGLHRLIIEKRRSDITGARPPAEEEL